MMRAIGTNIRSIRIQKGITQEELAQKLYITRQAVSSYETGRTRPDIDMLLKIADALDTDTNALLYGPVPTPEAHKTRRTFVIGILATVGLAAAYMLLRAHIDSVPETQVVRSIPLNLIRLTILPAVWFLVGWNLIQGLFMLPSLPTIRFKRQKAIGIAVWAALGIVMLLQLPYILFYGIGLYQSLTRASVILYFPNIPVYTPIATWLITGTLRNCGSYAIWGAALRFLRTQPKRE